MEDGSERAWTVTLRLEYSFHYQPESVRSGVTYRAFKDIQGFDIGISESRNERPPSIVLLFLDLSIKSASAARYRKTPLTHQAEVSSWSHYGR